MNLNLALIGNCQYSALIDTKGSVVWACFPRFDSPSVFGSLLDTDKGGQWTIEGAGEGWQSTARYIEHTCIVSTTWTRDGESFEVLDFAPRFPLYQRFYRSPMIVRLVRRFTGRPRVRVVCDPRFDYGRAATRFEIAGRSASAKGPADQRLVAVLGGVGEWEPRPEGGVQAVFRLKAGERGWVVISWNAAKSESILAYRPFEALRNTRRRWRD